MSSNLFPKRWEIESETRQLFELSGLNSITMISPPRSGRRERQFELETSFLFEFSGLDSISIRVFAQEITSCEYGDMPPEIRRQMLQHYYSYPLLPHETPRVIKALRPAPLLYEEALQEFAATHTFTFNKYNGFSFNKLSDAAIARIKNLKLCITDEQFLSLSTHDFKLLTRVTPAFIQSRLVKATGVKHVVLKVTVGQKDDLEFVSSLAGYVATFNNLLTLKLELTISWAQFAAYGARGAMIDMALKQLCESSGVVPTTYQGQFTFAMGTRDTWGWEAPDGKGIDFSKLLGSNRPESEEWINLTGWALRY